MTDKLSNQQNADKDKPTRDNIHCDDPFNSGPMKTEAKNTMPILDSVSASSLSCDSDSCIASDFYYSSEKKAVNFVYPFLRLNLKKRKPLVEFICYSLIPNHVHFMMRQLAEKGIEKFMQRIGTGYTMHFNGKYKRTGALFQGRFKSSKINPGNFLYLSAYINCNAEVHGIAKAESYQWSSYSDYLGKTKYGICNEKIIRSEFKGGDGYKDFAKENVKEMKRKKADEKLVLE